MKLKELQLFPLKNKSKLNPSTLCSSKIIPKLIYNAWKEKTPSEDLTENGQRKSESTTETTTKSPLDYNGEDYSEPLVNEDGIFQNNATITLNTTWVLARDFEHLGNDEDPV